MIKLYVAKTRSKITSEIFIREIVDKYLCIQPDKLIIRKDKYGKPFLVNFSNIHYNISHTKGLIVCAISDDLIGIDVERIRNFNKRIPQRFFTKTEYDYIFYKEKDENRRFFEVWTRKEAYVKWLGKGMEIPFDSFDVINETRIMTTYIDEYVVSICSNINIALDEGESNNNITMIKSPISIR